MAVSCSRSLVWMKDLSQKTWTWCTMGYKGLLSSSRGFCIHIMELGVTGSSRVQGKLCASLFLIHQVFSGAEGWLCEEAGAVIGDCMSPLSPRNKRNCTKHICSLVAPKGPGVWALLSWGLCERLIWLQSRCQLGLLSPLGVWLGQDLPLSSLRLSVESDSLRWWNSGQSCRCRIVTYRFQFQKEATTLWLGPRNREAGIIVLSL